MKCKLFVLGLLLVSATGCDGSDLRLASSTLSQVANDVAWAASRFYYWF